MFEVQFAERLVAMQEQNEDYTKVNVKEEGVSEDEEEEDKLGKGKKEKEDGNAADNAFWEDMGTRHTQGKESGKSHLDAIE